MKIKLDENMPVELTEDLRHLGHDVDTVCDEGLRGAPDSSVLEAAHSEGRILFTVDWAGSSCRLCERSIGLIVDAGACRKVHRGRVDADSVSLTSLAAGFDEFAGNVPRDIECFRNGAALRYQAGQFLGSGKEHSLGLMFDLNANRQLHAKNDANTPTDAAKLYRGP